MAGLGKKPKRKNSKPDGIFDVEKIKKAVEAEFRKGAKTYPDNKEYIKTGVPGFDGLFDKGIPKGNAVLIAGGAGSGKTIMCLQILAEAAKNGEKCLYMSFEESEERLKQHMRDFGWNPDELEKSGNLLIKRFSIFDVARSIDALLAKRKGELMIDVKPVILPDGFKPDRVVVDSLTAIASAFAGRETYRSYIEQLFRYFEELGTTSFLITETEQIPKIFSPTGVEEFLADGVIVLYNIRKGDIRENAIEVLKMRGAKHKKRIVAMQVTERGIEVFPEQEVFSNISEK
ncbi:MAG: ATPase domain-containing protein [Candidatus Anstonellales archaeon]